MWPFSKINRLQVELRILINKLDETNLSLSIIEREAERRYSNICRVLDIIVIEARENNKSFAEIMQKRITQLDIDLHQTAEESLTTARILEDVQIRIIQVENKLKEDSLLS